MSEAIRVGRRTPGGSFDLVLFTTGIIRRQTREETPEHVDATWDQLPEHVSRSFRV